ncbi:2,3-diaminopropionate biosynthesis protein SbnB [Kineosporia sp. NBRC 101677]|uniref:2,3-diaminopropionate biosynthesis protein SbnB n=1 Tax=Kineosporia sp. NBRC 101677 TaxID=3032197 RepID=UPI0024A4E783|nr:2,3-diaminopropionate biosynthesis protein SbnB [Kineosporia sp. NBRC 101677]GLY18824.1 2,3-diaminopropionate biosynthesis protein SbnB [Kineosporia sp. NBRC 101677]
MLIVDHATVRRVLDGRERELVELVGQTYAEHDRGRSSLPHSIFLRFPDEPRNRIIGLPAYLDGPPRAGIKWISSFPGNIDTGRERASAAIILNSMSTGHPEALVEGSLISARRTAASAALAARELAPADTGGIVLIGCGVINFEILRFAAAALPALRKVTLYDTDPARAEAFAGRAITEMPHLTVQTHHNVEKALKEEALVSLATNASTPHLDLSQADPATTVLHVSLRDLSVATVLAADNIVDDTDHVCREQTSLHLAEKATGKRDFVTATIGSLMRGENGTFRTHAARRRPVIFSPFGLGVLDLALAHLVVTRARQEGLGVVVDGFLPEPALA